MDNVPEKKKPFKSSMADFAKNHTAFHKACKLAGVEPSKNEARKYRSGYGKAFEFSTEKWRANEKRKG